MKTLINLLLAVTILSQSIVQLGLFVNFQINKTYIAQKLCENKSKPGLGCNGNCYLSKQLKKTEESEKKHAQNIIKEKHEIIPKFDRLTGILFYRQLNMELFCFYDFTFCKSDFQKALIKPPEA